MDKDFITKEFEERMTVLFSRMHTTHAGEDALMISAMEASAIMATINAKDLLNLKGLQHSELLKKCMNNASSFLYVVAVLADACGQSLNDVAHVTINALEEKQRSEGEILQ